MEINSLVVLLCFLAGVSDVDTYDLTLTVKEGDNITITCSHSNAYSNTKYFCREACDYEDILITSKGPNTAKYRIIDRGNDFDVTIYNLEEKDSGLYWCGIDRVGRDTYNRVDLTVKKPQEKKENEDKKNAITPETKITGENNKTVEVKGNVTDAPDVVPEPPPSSETVVYIGLGICCGVLVLVLLLFCLQRRRCLGASSAEKPERRSTNSPDPAAVIYSDVTVNRAFQVPADAALYCNMPSSQPRSMEVPPSKEVTYSAIRGAHADPV
ncbi:CMRF35-like molecule 5 [Synchiropus splendidus]|uniref:CMRF35-like molecule 5 n=1 Tax=Synchiropus splendidus TaxID=270530 RepID=UPI00237D333E|nr:CMRF35-like molecule 5 [Synchiropus splendidus]XP_053712989.1 CMRF35-like molecule 5 [Synchiropus splendidus]XP_053712990.1 CMRF35-like molecule 5 [Synchiropus splendidus]XP_053712991.1 CMRF35-like molecule 5 [Synchiropus splendidus]